MITSFVITGSSVLAGRVEVIGNLAGTAVGGPYKVPLRIVYPTGASPVLNRAVIEPWNNVFVEEFGVMGTTVFDFVYQMIGITHLVETMGYTYVEHEWNKQLVNGQLAAAFSSPHTAALFFGALAFPFDPTWLISAGTDGYEIMADASTFARNPLAWNPFAALPAPPIAAKCFAYGFSQPGMLLRGFAADLRNSTLGLGFPNGLVYEGTLAVACGAQKRTLTNVAPGFVTYSFHDGATPLSEGPLINLITETDLFLMEGIRARVAVPPAHYAFYEMAGISHLSGEAGTFIRAIHNDTAQGPVHRAMLENLRAKVDVGTAFPPSQQLQGAAATRTAPLFGGVSIWTGLPSPAGFTVNTFVGVPSEDDGNFLGGIRLPHVRTRLADGQCVGAPLATYRGTVCLDQTLQQNTVPNAVQLATVPPGFILGMELFLMFSGFTSPWEPTLINRRYRDACEYTTFVVQAADHALAQRWILQVDRDAYATTAAAVTDQDLTDYGLRRLVPPRPLIF